MLPSVLEVIHAEDMQGMVEAALATLSAPVKTGME
jgi:hypothetical protein